MDTSAQRSYIAIDLKSFYASAECVDRELDPLTTNLVVADGSRTNKTICLAVSPSMKALGVPNRCRVFEIPPGINYIMATPRMSRYIEVSAEVYGVYLRWFSKEDIHVYSIDEAFIDVTPYLGLYGMTPRELGEAVRNDVVKSTGIPATCGLGTNLYLAKVALDISAKHSPDFFGELTEQTFRATLWNHLPLTDFWHIGRGTVRRLSDLGIHTMGELALAPQEPLYRVFGINAEILIDHAWGREPVRMEHIKAYRSKSHSLSNGQVLARDTSWEDSRLLVKEMIDTLALQLVRERKVAESVSVWAGGALTQDEKAWMRQHGPMGAHYYGGPSSGGAKRLFSPTNSRHALTEAVLCVFDEVVDRSRPIRRLGVAVDHVTDEKTTPVQLGLFSQPEAEERERKSQEAVSAIKAKFGVNSLLKGMDLYEAANIRERNMQIGGHRSGAEQPPN